MIYFGHLAQSQQGQGNNMNLFHLLQYKLTAKCYNQGFTLARKIKFYMDCQHNSQYDVRLLSHLRNLGKFCKSFNLGVLYLGFTTC